MFYKYEDCSGLESSTYVLKVYYQDQEGIISYPLEMLVTKSMCDVLVCDPQSGLYKGTAQDTKSLPSQTSLDKESQIFYI